MAPVETLPRTSSAKSLFHESSTHSSSYKLSSMEIFFSRFCLLLPSGESKAKVRQMKSFARDEAKRGGLKCEDDSKVVENHLKSAKDLKRFATKLRNCEEDKSHRQARYGWLSRVKDARARSFLEVLALFTARRRRFLLCGLQFADERMSETIFPSITSRKRNFPDNEKKLFLRFNHFFSLRHHHQLDHKASDKVVGQGNSAKIYDADGKCIIAVLHTEADSH